MPVQKLQTYEDFERQQNAFMEQMKKHDMQCVSCPNCGSQFFEQFEVAKFKADHNVILGQDIPISPGSAPYKLLRCVFCKDVLEPRIIHHTRDVIGGDYDQLLDTLEGKLDIRPKVEKKKEEEKNEVQVEEL